jgi:cytochrome c nitrite reductase small subunit
MRWRRWLFGGSLLTALIWVLTGILLGAGTYTVYYGEGLSYLSSDPKACVNCHIMREQYDSWQKASHHHAATCVDCHLPHDFVRKYLAKAENGFWHSKGFTLQDFHEPIQIREKNAVVLQENCLRCHQDFVHTITVTNTAKGEVMSCTHCHVHVGHGPSR